MYMGLKNWFCDTADRHLRLYVRRALNLNVVYIKNPVNDDGEDDAPYDLQRVVRYALFFPDTGFLFASPEAAIGEDLIYLTRLGTLAIAIIASMFAYYRTCVYYYWGCYPDFETATLDQFNLGFCWDITSPIFALTGGQAPPDTLFDIYIGIAGTCMLVNIFLYVARITGIKVHTNGTRGRMLTFVQDYFTSFIIALMDAEGVLYDEPHSIAAAETTTTTTTVHQTDTEQLV
jgi:hypothetical protein